ncbi:MAG: DUF3362 domain-containing protein, partial [Methanoregula sp.]|nr:DUF3362 domain-containing protein [Methanoregula sp.]
HVAKGREKQIQRALLQYREPRNLGLVLEGLEAAGRKDLIGNGVHCLVGPGTRNAYQSFGKFQGTKK